MSSKKESPPVAKKLQEIWGKDTVQVTCPMRNCKDVENFIKKIIAARERARHSKLRFGFAAA
jgi:hypothetical protein